MHMLHTGNGYIDKRFSMQSFISESVSEKNETRLGTRNVSIISIILPSLILHSFIYRWIYLFRLLRNAPDEV